MGRGLRCASWRYLLLGELQALLPLETELLHRKHYFARADRRDLEAPDDVPGLHAIDLVVGHVAQHRDAARREAAVVVDPHELQVRQERPDGPRLEHPQERIPPARPRRPRRSSPPAPAPAAPCCPLWRNRPGRCRAARPAWASPAPPAAPPRPVPPAVPRCARSLASTPARLGGRLRRRPLP